MWKENILYIAPDEKRTDNWLQSLGLQLPPLDHQYGSIREVTLSTNSIPDSPEKSNRQNSLKTEDLLSPDYGNAAQPMESKHRNESTEERAERMMPLLHLLSLNSAKTKKNLNTPAADKNNIPPSCTNCNRNNNVYYAYEDW